LPHPLNRGKDEDNIRYAIELLRDNDIKFMRLVLQDTGSAGQLVADGRLKNEPWAENIWARNSPYIKAALNADRYPFIETSLMQAENGLMRSGGVFYNLERMDQWHEAETIDNMLKVNQEAIAFLQERLQQSGAPR
jgi:hypothetical protein